MLVLILVVLFTLLISFHCSLFEAVLYSTRIGTLEASRASGHYVVKAEKFIDMKKKIGVPLAAVLILNTVANTAGATVAGFFASEVFGASQLTLFSILFTLLILLFGEILPKTLGAVHWRDIWHLVVLPITVLKYVLYPAVVLTQKFSGLVAKGNKTATITEAEILAAVRMGAIEGEISQNESEVVHNIINLENKPVREIMTPRTVIFSLDAEMPVDEALKAVDRKGFTRIPIFEKDSENITGYIMIHDLYSMKTMSQPGLPIKTIAKPITFTPATGNSLALLAKFLKQRRHIAVVVDEYGGVAGLVTLEDLIETILGDEIVDETDREVDLQETARQISSQRIDV